MTSLPDQNGGSTIEEPDVCRLETLFKTLDIATNATQDNDDNSTDATQQEHNQPMDDSSFMDGVRVHVELGQQYMSEKRFAESFAEYEKAVDLLRQVPGHYELPNNIRTELAQLFSEKAALRMALNYDSAGNL